MGIKTIKIRLNDYENGFTHFVLITVNKDSVEIEAFDDEKETLHSCAIKHIAIVYKYEDYEEDRYTKVPVKNGKAKTRFFKGCIIPQYLFLFGNKSLYIIDLYDEFLSV